MDKNVSYPAPEIFVSEAPATVEVEVAKDKFPEPSVWITWFAEPSK